ncbi:MULTISPECIES: ethanolamine ammonia-lyase subunit EutC [Acidobacteriaceae]|uniref:ethanolamine ammonia-lyase subunit EutC n=1 Tax=Acidobacteriaceae TaxID=204434 RepID=UPI00131E83BD|nr:MULTISPECIES: ethanolamine ammonia-lyase subunit EutC [Acidobacteriaceae]MDW5265965.1 ethanolamine ammonia-lyase subunit EutC [Edaphobacter sp.]
MIKSLAKPDPWRTLSRFTQAHIGLGRVGSSLPTEAMLSFSMAHARARNVIYAPFQPDTLSLELKDAGFYSRRAWSQAKDRIEYLHRPDLGRRLSIDCISDLQPTSNSARRLTIVIADGLSSLAPQEHSLALLKILKPQLVEWDLDDIVLATQARVALGDEIGAIRGAEAVVILIGERPGLTAADSLGAYITYEPYVGRSDAERNCISNIRPAGLSYEQAAYKLVYLLREARVLGGTGVRLKDDSTVTHLTASDESGSTTLQMKKTVSRPGWPQ